MLQQKEWVNQDVIHAKKKISLGGYKRTWREESDLSLPFSELGKGEQSAQIEV